MTLGSSVELHIEHRQVGSTRLPWATTYAVVTEVGDLAYGDARDLLESIALAEQELYYSVVKITGGAARRWLAKTTVPDPTPPPYNPADHVSISLDLPGLRSTGDELLYYDQVLDIERIPDFGNIGHIELRGALSQSEVDSSLSLRSLSPAARTAWLDRITTFKTEISAAATATGVTFRMISQPLTSTTYSIGPNGKPKAVRTYGAASFRQVVDWGLGLVRTDKGHNKYFDHDV